MWCVIPTVEQEVSERRPVRARLWRPTHCAVRVVNPVWCKQTTEGCNKHKTAVVGHSLRQLGDLGRGLGEAQVVHKELHP